jgi:hypothetical protein
MQEEIEMLGTTILVAFAVLMAAAVRYFRGTSSARRTSARLWTALAISLAVATAFLVVLKARIVPITPVNFSVIVFCIVYFSLVECFRIHRQLASLR